MHMVYYIGGFPPPYGGVTVKNELLFSALAEKMGPNLKKLDTQKAKKNPLLLLAQGLLLLANRRHPLIIATAGPQRKRITLFLNRFNRKVLRKSSMFVMGGHFADRIKDDPAYIAALKEYRRIYVETDGMQQELAPLGFTNVSVYPNCRQHPLRTVAVAPAGDPLRCVFFSLVSPDKGADTVLSAARQLPDVTFDFYGVVEPAWKDAFLREIDEIPNAAYHGVFQVQGDNVYSKLNEYDLLLLPTKCISEGVPGILVEAKIAAVPSVVSNVSYNAEIVEDGVSGLVLSENTPDALADSITLLDRDRELLYRLKTGALASAEQYYIDCYADSIIFNLEGN